MTLAAGFSGTLLPAFGYLPAIGFKSLSLAPWKTFFSFPGIGTAIGVTLFSGIGASFCVVVLSFLFAAFFHGTRGWKFFEKSLSPILSIPHAAFAVGFGFLFAPSGWLVRMVSPVLTGFEFPPDLIFLNDPFGISLTIALVIKEFPFMILVILGGLSQIDVEQTLLAGRALGYKREQVWLKIILPQLYTRLRLTVFAVIAYSLSVVDMAIILGPSSPPTLGVMILNWFNDPDVSFKLLAASGSLFLFLLVCLSVAGVYLLEKWIRIPGQAWITNGKRSSPAAGVRPALFFWGTGIFMVTVLASLVLFVWSFAWQWRFPDTLPSSYTLSHWAKGIKLSAAPVMTTLYTGAAATLLGIILIIGCLEHEAGRNSRKEKIKGRLDAFVYLPLMIPQITFMAGIQLLLVIVRMDGYWISLLWSHILFVLPYLFIVLKATYLSYDGRYFNQAMLLKGSYPAALFRVKLPMLIRPVLFAAAIGFSVSVAQYIPTVLVGAGRFSTITTEVVSIATGSDRRVLAVYALIQQMLPMMGYAAAIFIPKFLYFNRRGMQV